MSIARCVIDAKAALGETPVWSAAENRLYWIDCIAGLIHSYDPVADEDTLMPIEVEGYLGSISLRAQGGLLILAGKALWALDAGSTTPRRLAGVEEDMAARQAPVSRSTTSATAEPPSRHCWRWNPKSSRSIRALSVPTAWAGAPTATRFISSI